MATNPWDEDTSNQSSNKAKPTIKHQADETNNISELLKLYRSRQRASNSPKPAHNSMPFGPVYLGWILVGVLFIWLCSGFYRVQPDEQGAVFYFGKLTTITESGLNYHLPYPVGFVVKRSVTNINKAEFKNGFVTNNTTNNSQLGNNLSPSLMLTGDENIVDIDFEVQWRISDLGNYLLSLEDPAGTLKEVATSAMREVIGTTPITDALSTGKSEIEFRTKVLLQKILDQYKSGIEVTLIQLLRVDPPSQVINSFRDIQTAKADKESSINEAEAYYNDVIPKARGEAEQIIKTAEAYKIRTVLEAEGQTKRFLAIYREYLNHKNITTDRMYLETLEKVLQNSHTIILDKSANRDMVPYLPLK